MSCGFVGAAKITKTTVIFLTPLYFFYIGHNSIFERVKVKSVEINLFLFKDKRLLRFRQVLLLSKNSSAKLRFKFIVLSPVSSPYFNACENIDS